MAAVRRLGATDSKTREQLLDATEQLMLEAGYAAATSRKVAGRAGLKPQLVHYYFRSMDDLFLAVYRRRADQNLVRVERALASDRPLHALWEFGTDPRGTAFMMEFAALANHRKAIKAEIAHDAERYRAMQLDVISRALDERGVSLDGCPPIVLLVAMTGVSQVLGLEHGLGVDLGHAETFAVVERYLAQLEGPGAAARFRPDQGGSP